MPSAATFCFSSSEASSTSSRSERLRALGDVLDGRAEARRGCPVRQLSGGAHGLASRSIFASRKPRKNATAIDDERVRARRRPASAAHRAAGRSARRRPGPAPRPSAPRPSRAPRSGSASAGARTRRRRRAARRASRAGRPAAAAESATSWSLSATASTVSSAFFVSGIGWRRGGRRGLASHFFVGGASPVAMRQIFDATRRAAIVAAAPSAA